MKKLIIFGLLMTAFYKLARYLDNAERTSPLRNDYPREEDTDFIDVSEPPRPDGHIVTG